MSGVASAATFISLPCIRAMAIALLPLMNPITEATAYLSKVAIHIMHVIWNQMTFNDLAFFLPGQFVKDLAKLPAYFPIKRLAAIFEDENNMIFAIPLRVGQALVSTVHFVLLLVCLIKPPNENNI
jgi:hypothetical protein